MSLNRVIAIAAACALLVLAGCGDDEEEETPAASSEPTPAAEVSTKAKNGDGGGKPSRTEEPGTEIRVSDSQFGGILFNRDKQAIYLFAKEQSGKSECYGDCAAAWPPVLTEGEPEAGSGADAKLLGTTERDDGSTQVTYNGHPLYYYAHEGPGQVLCHNVSEFGGLWLVVEPGGDAVS